MVNIYWIIFLIYVHFPCCLLFSSCELHIHVGLFWIRFWCCLQVVRAKKKDTGTVYALKIMDKKFITKENKTAYVKLERIVLDQLDHSGVVRLYFTFQDTFSLCRYSWLYQLTVVVHTCLVSFYNDFSPLISSSFSFCLHLMFLSLIILWRHGTWIMWRWRAFWPNNKSKLFLACSWFRHKKGFLVWTFFW